MKIAIIGGAGFIGSHVTRQCLAASHSVRVSAHQPEDKARYAHLHDLTHANDRLELIPLDLLDAEAIPGFIAGCDTVIHTGTPFQLGFEDPVRELIEPPVNGTKNLLSAVAGEPNVKKLVVVASVASYNTHFPLDVPGKEGTVTEADEPYFSAEDHPYAQGKYLADQAVREFIDDYAGDCEIVTVCPVGVFGKSLSDRTDSTSVGLQHLIKSKTAPDPFIQMLFDQDVPFAVVDVEDVARAIVAAATTSGLHGKHYLLSSASHRISDLNRMLNGDAPLNPGTAVYDAGASKRDLGMTYSPASQFL